MEVENKSETMKYTSHALKSCKIDYNIQGAIEFKNLFYALTQLPLLLSSQNKKRMSSVVLKPNIPQKIIFTFNKIKLYPVSFSTHNTLKIFVYIFSKKFCLF